MKKIIPLMRREWLQHRFGWALMALVPLLLGLLLTGFGHVQIGSEEADIAGDALPVMLASVSIAATTALVFIIVWVSSLIIVSGLARRDHGDRSVEFWLSLPASHSASLGSPMLVHLLLAPAVALAVGLLSGYAISAMLVSRVVGVDAWLALPWTDIVPATLAVALRLLLGLPLATLWLLPLILTVVLLTAWFKRWGWVILTVGVGLGGVLLDRVFGQPLLSQVIRELMQHATHAFVNNPDFGQTVQSPADAFAALRAVPGWALVDAGRALRDLASPLLVGGLLFAAGCFALLVQWRERGAGASS